MISILTPKMTDKSSFKPGNERANEETLHGLVKKPSFSVLGMIRKKDLSRVSNARDQKVFHFFLSPSPQILLPSILYFIDVRKA